MNSARLTASLSLVCAGLFHSAAIADRPLPPGLTLEQKVCMSTHVLRLLPEPETTRFELWKPSSDGKSQLQLSTTESVSGQLPVVEASVVSDLLAPAERPKVARVYVSGFRASDQRSELSFFLVWDEQRSKALGRPTFSVPRHPIAASAVEQIDPEVLSRVSKLSFVAMDGSGLTGNHPCKPKGTLSGVVRHAS